MEKNYNEIDDFFKKAFEQESASGEGWNVPSDEIWEKLSETERERRPMLIYWKWAAVAAGILLFFLAGQSIYHQNQLQQQARKIEQLEQQIQSQELEQVENNLPKSGINTNVTENFTNLPNLDDPVKEIAIPPTSNISAESTLPINKIQEKQDAVVIEKTSPLIESPLPSTSIFLEKEEVIEELVSTTSLLPTAPPNLNVPKLLIKKSKPSYFTANYAITESAQTFDHSRIQTLRRSNVIKEQNLNLGLRYAHFLDKNWFVESGLHYSKSTAERRHLLRSRFQRDNERPNNNGNFESTHNLSLFSSAYELETDVVLSRSSGSSTSLDGRNLRLIGIVTNEIQQLSIPILLGHRLEYQKWNWTMKAGFTPTVKLLDEVRLDRILSSESEFMVKAVTRTQRRSNQQGISTDWYFYAGTSLFYQLNKTWAIQLEPYFSRSLSAQTNIQNNTVFNHSAGVHLGLRYAL